jgi:phosphonate transport system substrate-binding protein
MTYTRTSSGRPPRRRPLAAPVNAWALVAVLVGAAAAPMVGGCGDGGGATAGGASGRGGTPKELVLGFVPSLEADKIADNAKPMAAFLGQELGVPVRTYTSTDYVGLIEAMGSGKVDIGALAPFAYVLANDQNGAQVLLKSSRKGAVTYHAIFLARAGSGIARLEDAKGKRMAFVDEASASGYLFPAAYLKAKGYDPDTFFAQTKFAGSHDNAIRAVYNGDVDVCSVYDDARNKLEDTLPDVKQKVVVIGKTDEIPNDTFSVRKDLDPELAGKIKAALLKYAATPEGKKTLLDTYEIDGLAEATDADYDVVRQTARAMDVGLSSLDKKPSAAAGAPKAAAPAAAATSQAQ